MKKFFLGLLIVMLSFVILTGCTKNKEVEENIDLSSAKWEAVLSTSKGQTVNIHMWGGDDSVNRYMDEWVTPRMKADFDITLNRVPINDAKDMLNKLLTEKDVQKQKEVLIFWINGENFKIAKENELLWGAFVDKLPNYNTYVNKEALDIKYDFGEDTKGLEAPWGKSQFVFIYDSEKIKNPPKSMKSLKEWAKDNPGKFTYPESIDFTGSAFIRHALFETTGGYEQYLTEIDQEKFKQQMNPLWNYLNEIKPYLWRKGKTYPESSAKLDELYGNGEVWMSLSYNPVHAFNKMKIGQFPKTTKTFLLNGGTLANTHYLSIPFNATNKAGAMVVIDFLLSPEAQIKKFDPTYWGDGSVLSFDKLSDADQKAFNAVDRGSASVSSEILEKNRIPEISAEYVDEIERGWIENVAKNKPYILIFPALTVVIILFFGGIVEGFFKV